MAELAAFSKQIHESQLAPRGLDTPQKIFAAVQLGFELGISPMQAISNIAVVNGRASLMGDLALALVRGSRLCNYITSEVVGEGESRGVRIKSFRKDDSTERFTVFTVADAKRAGLWAKAGVWSQYPQRMLYYRALGFHLRDYYSDVLKGLAITEEVGDYRHTIGEARQLPEPPGEADPLAKMLVEGPKAEAADELPESPPPDGKLIDDGMPSWKEFH